MTKPAKLTPMLQQYMEIKEQHKESILFYRMGDFYEMFFDDAITASKVLSITLTSRNKKSDPVQVPMCGIPFHAARTYLAKLIRAGHRVAICEQVENPAEAKGIVKREVVQVVSPGIVTDVELLDDSSDNFLCSLSCRQSTDAIIFGLSFVDVSTGKFFIGEFKEYSNRFEDILDQFTRLNPSEILVRHEEDDTSVQSDLLKQVQLFLPNLCITKCPSDSYHLETCTDFLLDHFKILSLDGFGCSQLSEGIIAAGVLLHYIIDTQKSSVDHIEKLSLLETDDILHIDTSSRRNLELTQTIVDGNKQGSLLSVIDNTCTPMGARLFRHNLLFPLQNFEKINARLNATTFFFKNSSSRKELRELLEKVYDLERLNSRMTLGSANGRDMLALKNSLAGLPEISTALLTCNTENLITIREQFDTLQDLYLLLESSIHPEAPINLREGNLIRDGYNNELDEILHLLRDGKKLIFNLEAQERTATGIAKLKVGYNKVFGYFIEISKAWSDKAPSHYIRKQTLVNAERFITDELKDFEQKVLSAQDRRVDLEYQIFSEIRGQIASQSGRILKTARLLAQLDYLLSNAITAHKYNYRRPNITTEDELHIIEGRHPIIERTLPSGAFVPNDVHLDQKDEEVLIITGPNMAGKSTVLRQTALIVLMAQMGCYVPVDSAQIGIVDRIFTRVGAMDNLRLGQSTFMVEMSETANILNNATERSLVILDEIGRGTSTYDGLSIAWAVAEDLVNKNSKGVKTLFATHYHELTDLAKNNKRIRNYSIGVREWQGDIIFLHKLVKGGTSRSYGIQVAALAGVPKEVVNRAKVILRDIELGKFSETLALHTAPLKKQKKKQHPGQLSLFTSPSDPIHDYLNKISINDCTPMEALTHLYSMQQIAAGEGKASNKNQPIAD